MSTETAMPPSQPSPVSTPVDAPSPQPTPQTTTGPLCSLADQASNSTLARKFAGQCPKITHTASSMRNLLVVADDGIAMTRKTMATNEGRRLTAALFELGSSILAFIRMIFIKLLQIVENYLHIPETSPQDPPLSTTARCRRIITNTSETVCKKFSNRQNAVSGTAEEQVFIYAKMASNFMFSVFMCLLSGLLRFDGPGKDYVLLFTNKFVELLPPSLAESLKTTDGPVTVIKRYVDVNDDHQVEVEREKDE